jgi:hypothetical protein
MRLIDAGALTEQMHNHYEVRNPKQNATMDECCMMVFNAPTIDAVPVVRCKDCKHWNKDALACDTLPWVDSSEHANWYADDFCSYGERKDGDGNG